MAYNCIIVDDEKRAHAVLENYISRIGDLQLQGNAFNAVQAKNIITAKNIDLVFLDINMPEISGIDLLKTENLTEKIILTTAYSDFALDGFNLDVVDYLLKPIPYPRFEKAIEKFKKLMDANASDLFIHLKCDGIKKKFLYKDILYFQSIGNYVKIVTSDKMYMTILTMAELETQIAHQYFIRIHKSYMVPAHIIKQNNDVQKININEVVIPIGRTYKNVVMEILSS
jgi:two-component system, LytTR family, response regulator